MWVMNALIFRQSHFQLSPSVASRLLVGSRWIIHRRIHTLAPKVIHPGPSLCILVALSPRFMSARCQPAHGRPARPRAESVRCATSTAGMGLSQTRYSSPGTSSSSAPNQEMCPPFGLGYCLLFTISETNMRWMGNDVV